VKVMIVLLPISDFLITNLFVTSVDIIFNLKLLIYL
jgi:hypothetical protein